MLARSVAELALHSRIKCGRAWLHYLHVKVRHASRFAWGSSDDPKLVASPNFLPNFYRYRLMRCVAKYIAIGTEHIDEMPVTACIGVIANVDDPTSHRGDQRRPCRGVPIITSVQSPPATRRPENVLSARRKTPTYRRDILRPTSAAHDVIRAATRNHVRLIGPI